MGELVVNMFVTLDGVVQGPGGPNEDTEGGFKQGGWQAPFMDDESGKLIGENIERMDALLLGRKTYDIFANYWPKAPKDNPIAAKLNNAPKYVASRKAKKVEWKNSTLIPGDVTKEIPRIKNKHGEVHVIGSANFVQTLLKHGLVDRFNLWVHPVILGNGKRLFEPGAMPSALRLVKSQSFPKGPVLLQYKQAGKPTFRSLDAETVQTA